MINVAIEADFKDLQGRFKKADDNLKSQASKSVTFLAKRWTFLAKSEAPQKSGFFKQSISSETFAEKDAIGFRGTSERPLGKWIIEGTKPHKIRARNVDALYFFWKRVGRWTLVPRKGKGITENRKNNLLVIGKGYVDHPGTKANPFTERALDRFVPEAKAELNKIAKQWAMTFGA